MIDRLCSLLKMQKPALTSGLLFASGKTKPVDGTAGYCTGCLFQHTDGTSGTSFYVNEGTETSCDFNAIGTPELTSLANLSDVGATAYTAGKILVADGNSYEEVAVSGAATLASDGAITIPLLGATAGVVAASLAVIVTADKDAGDFRNLDCVNLDAGSSGVAGSVDIFPSTAVNGKFSIVCAAQGAGNATSILQLDAMAQACTVHIPNPGAVANSYLVQSTAALSLAEVDVLDGVTAGAAVASKAVILGADKGISRLFVNTAPETYDISSLGVGTYSVPVVDTSLLDNIAFTANMSTATNKTSADTSCMAAFIGVSNTAHTTNNKIQGLLVSNSLGFNCFDAYAVQGHTTVGSGGVSTKNANAHIAGVSGKVKLTGAVGQGWVTGVLGILEGAGAVTGLCHAAAFQVETGVTGCDAVVYIGNDAAATEGIYMTGNYTHLFNGAKVDNDAAADDYAFGFSVSCTVNKSTEANSCLGGYFRVTNTVATANARLQGLLVSNTTAYNCFDSYAIQGHVTVGSLGVSTKNANAHIAGVSGKALLSGAVGQGWVTGLLGIIDGTGAVTGMCYAISGQIEATTSANACDGVLSLGADQTVPTCIDVLGTANMTAFIKFNAIAGCIVANALVPETAPTGSTMGAAAAILVKIGTDSYYIPLYDQLA